MEIELSWLYKTWALHRLDQEYDLVIYHNPTASHRLVNFQNTVNIPMAPIRMATEYKFLNSHYFCTKGYDEPLKSYAYLMKTDCDVFLTSNLMGHTPTKLQIGEGGYYKQGDEKSISIIKQISKSLGLGYNHMPSIGASFFGKTKDVLNLTSSQVMITEYLLKNWHRIEGIKIFKKGIASMIAGEIAVNHCFNNQHVALYTLDTLCWRTRQISKEILHIHAWHSEIAWSKHDFFAGKYSNWSVSQSEAYDNAANYCQWIATTPLEEIYKLAN